MPCESARSDLRAVATVRKATHKNKPTYTHMYAYGVLHTYEYMHISAHMCIQNIWITIYIFRRLCAHLHISIYIYVQRCVCEYNKHGARAGGAWVDKLKINDVVGGPFTIFWFRWQNQNNNVEWSMSPKRLASPPTLIGYASGPCCSHRKWAWPRLGARERHRRSTSWSTHPTRISFSQSTAWSRGCRTYLPDLASPHYPPPPIIIITFIILEQPFDWSMQKRYYIFGGGRCGHKI